MEPDRAIEIVQSLADGMDPYSGERFPSSSPYQQADTVRALHLALEGLAKLKRSTARKTGPGRPWTEDEEQELLREFDDKIDVEEIAAKHERTKGAIWARLEKLGRIQRKDFPGSTPHPPTADNAKFTPTLRNSLSVISSSINSVVRASTLARRSAERDPIFFLSVVPISLPYLPCNLFR